MESYHEVIIDWYTEENFKTNNISTEGRGFLYCHYSESHIYGQNVLSYIGRSERDAGLRLQEHLKSFFGFVEMVERRIGIVKQDDGISLEEIESILIANHKPYYNKEYLHEIHPASKSRKIIVINNLHRGQLKNSCTNYWWVTRMG
jgi:hypothetical protein